MPTIHIVLYLVQYIHCTLSLFLNKPINDMKY